MAMSFKAKFLLAGVTAMMAAACAPVDPGFGDALRYDMAAQTIDPDPVYAEGGAQPGGSGEKAAKATERYRKGQTKPVERISASSGSGSSGGGSGPQ
jgi:hypothetical protein